jgi:hypothetical protein
MIGRQTANRCDGCPTERAVGSVVLTERSYIGGSYVHWLDFDQSEGSKGNR